MSLVYVATVPRLATAIRNQKSHRVGVREHCFDCIEARASSLPVRSVSQLTCEYGTLGRTDAMCAQRHLLFSLIDLDRYELRKY